MTGFVLCADDFALTRGISRGILELLAAGRLTATGAMTNRPHWRSFAPALGAFSGKADLGLHLNLTCAAPLTAMRRFAPGDVFPSLPAVLKAGATRSLPEDELRNEIDAQLSAFEDAMGRAPDFIDGHQHVHGLPGVRDVFLDVISGRYRTSDRPWVRLSGDRVARIRARGLFVAKALNVKALSAGFARRLAARGFLANDGFAGFSNFDPAADYGKQFESYLVAPGPRHLVMCHPGHVDDELASLDPVTASRENELSFLLGPGFGEACARADTGPARLRALTST